jgi:hypothetical protein
MAEVWKLMMKSPAKSARSPSESLEIKGSTQSWRQLHMARIVEHSWFMKIMIIVLGV